MNSVRLYSNGTAVIGREYAFEGPEPLRISIPVRKTDLDDVVSSLAVFGDVAVVEPPTYAPTNAEAPTLAIEPANALRDLATKLAGAAVEVEAGPTYAGRLVGLHAYRREVQGATQQEYRLVILTEKGVQQVAESAVTALRFTEPAVQAEVDKALRASLGRIRPDSSRVELTLRPHPGATAAVVTYATPVAAWKIRYQLRMTPDGAELDGQAVVDNDTDDDWADAQVTVITGEPITFATDLAEVRRPARGRVNLVAERAAGAVVAEPDLPVGAAPPEEKSRGGYGGGYGGGGGGGGYGGGGAGRPAGRVMVAMAAPAPGASLKRAEQLEAEAREGGDFTLFTSPNPVSIGAGRSAVVPLFRVAVGEPRAVLLYRERDDPRRPFRAVRFRNDAPHALGRGVCEVFDAGDFRGKGLLEATRPGGECLLVHARETGVSVYKKAHRAETRRLSIRIAAGVIVNQVLHRQRTTYRVGNGHPEAFALEIEHTRTWPDSELSATLPSGTPEEADIPSGKRFRVPLAAGGSLEVRVVEERIQGESFALKNTSWLLGNVVELTGPAGQDEGVRRCIDLERQVDAVEAEVRAAVERSATLADEQERLIKLIPNAHAEQANSWRTDLADAERELREVKRSTLPGLQAKLKEAQDALHAALAGLQYQWEEPARGETR